MRSTVPSPRAGTPRLRAPPCLRLQISAQTCRLTCLPLCAPPHTPTRTAIDLSAAGLTWKDFMTFDVINAACATVLMGMSFGAIMPTLSPHLEKQLKLRDTAHVGMTYMIPALVYGVACPFVGAISDRLGYRRIIALGFTLLTVAFIMMGAKTTLSSPPCAPCASGLCGVREGGRDAGCYLSLPASFDQGRSRRWPQSSASGGPSRMAASSLGFGRCAEHQERLIFACHCRTSFLRSILRGLCGVSLLTRNTHVSLPPADHRYGSLRDRRRLRVRPHAACDGARRQDARPQRQRRHQRDVLDAVLPWGGGRAVPR